MTARDVENVFVDIVEQAKVLDPVNTRNWFDKLTVLDFEGGALEVGCPDEATAQFLSDKCKSGFMHAAQQITGHLVSVSFNVDTRKDSGRFLRPRQPGLRLNPDYTFANFVVGPSNRLAHASCVAVSQSPGLAPWTKGFV